MSSTTRSSAFILLAAVLFASACGQDRGDPPSGGPAVQADDAAPGETASDLPRRIDPAPIPADRSSVVAQEDISVNGEPACALTVRYAGELDHEVTWNGEACRKISVGFVNLADLERIGQARKLDEETRDDLARLPDGRALYVEGEFASAIYPLNVVGLPREVWLAD